MTDWQRFFSEKEYRESVDKEFLTEIDTKIFESLKGKKFFELKDLQIIPNFEKYWFRIIEAEKNVGKTKQVTEILWDVQKSETRKIMFGRKTRDEMKTVGDAMNNDTAGVWPFRMGKGNNLYDKETGRHCGKLFYLKGAGLKPFASNQFPDYDEVVIDEYQSSSEDKELTRLVREFIIFLLNVKRDKPSIKVTLLGNTYSLFDPFRIYFQTDYSQKYLKDEKRGILILNLAGIYKGVSKKGNVSNLLDYDTNLKNFVNGSTSFDDVRNILPKPLFKKLVLRYQLVINKEAYAVYNLTNGLAIEDVKKIYLENETYCTSLRDLALVPNGMIINQKENFDVGEEIINYIYENRILYNTPETLNKITAFFNVFMSKYINEINKIYGEI